MQFVDHAVVVLVYDRCSACLDVVPALHLVAVTPCVVHIICPTDYQVPCTSTRNSDLCLSDYHVPCTSTHQQLASHKSVMAWKAWASCDEQVEH
jgi:hypothetical protein